MTRGFRMNRGALSILRRLSRRRLCLALLAFEIFGVFVVAWVWIVPEVEAVRECFAHSEAEHHRVNLQRNHDEAFRAVGIQIEGLQRKMTLFGSLSMDDSLIHSWARELADVAGLTLTQFVAMEAEGEYLTTLEGAYVNAVLLASRLEGRHSALRVRRFIARHSQVRDDHLELELLIQNSSPTTELSLTCDPR